MRLLTLALALSMWAAGAVSQPFNPPKVDPEIEPLVRELIEVTKGKARVEAVLRTTLSLESMQTMPGIPASAAIDHTKTTAALKAMAAEQQQKYRRIQDAVLDGADLDGAAWYVYGALYGEGWTRDELKGLIAFYRGPLGAKVMERDSQFHFWEQVRLSEFLSDRIRTARESVEREELLKNNPARVAGDDLRKFGVLLEMYAYENEGMYPEETDPRKLQKLVGPPEYPVVDPWGTPFRFEFSADRKGFRITSAGTDRSFSSNRLPWGTKPTVDKTEGADIVFENGIFVSYPPGATKQRL